MSLKLRLRKLERQSHRGQLIVLPAFGYASIAEAWADKTQKPGPHDMALIIDAPWLKGRKV